MATHSVFAELHRQADTLLYDAKFAGRNRTKISQPQATKDQPNSTFDDAAACG